MPFRPRASTGESRAVLRRALFTGFVDTISHSHDITIISGKIKKQFFVKKYILLLQPFFLFVDDGLVDSVFTGSIFLYRKINIALYPSSNGEIVLFIEDTSTFQVIFPAVPFNPFFSVELFVSGYSVFAIGQ